ncbi:hypothetical protein H0H93_007434 [Arthromyces matolae]|nr:hypothetical protein H0H93_007434 [Arthromyces matolae]
MHICLQIPQVLALIFEYLREEEDDEALANLATTCKTFSHPALDALWYTQLSLFNLLKCFPEHIWGLRDNPYHGECTLFFRTRPKVEDYERIKLYASRIRILGDDKAGAENQVDDMVYSVLLSRQSTSGLYLPRLHTTFFDINRFIGQAIYPRFITGQLRNLHSVTFTGNSDSGILEVLDEYWDNIAAVFSIYLPHLYVFEVKVLSRDAYRRWDVLCVKSLFCAFRGLKTLNVGRVTLTPDVLAHLATVSTLTTLVFAALSKDLEASGNLLSISGAYSGLESLGIFTDSSRGCGVFLSHLDLCRLMNLAITHSEDGRWDLDDIISNLRTPNLESLYLRKSGTRDIHPALLPLPFTSSMLDSLLRISTLTELRITFDLALNLNKDDILAIAATWPHLQTLCLPDNRIDTETSLTFRDLLPLIQHCKDLEFLTIRVDFQHNSIPCFSQTGDLGSLELLRDLDFCTSPLWPHADELAILIPLLFPNLRQLNISKFYSLYGTINNHLPHLESLNREAWRNVIKRLKPLGIRSY